MTANIEEIAAERDGAMQTLAAVRVALGTPPHGDVVQHAEQVAASARMMGAIVAADIRFINEIHRAAGFPDGEPKDDADGTPPILAHLQQLTAELQRARVDLAEAAAYREGMEFLAAFVNRVVAAAPSAAEGDAYIAHIEQLAADAAKWRALPWDRLRSVVYPWWATAMDDLYDLRTWYERNRPQEGME